MWFLEIFAEPRIYCFEPDPRAIARFKRTLCDHPEVELFEVALSDSDGETTFYQSSGQKSERHAAIMPEGWDRSGSIRPPKQHLRKHPWVKFDPAIKVKTSTLDSWAENRGLETIDFIWMDVQGAEINVFKGGRDTLNNTRFVYTEYSNQELYEGQPGLSQLVAQMEDFEILAIYPDDVLLRNRKFELPPNKALQRMLASLRGGSSTIPKSSLLQNQSELLKN